MKRKYVIALIVAAAVLGVVGMAYAAFADRGDVKGTTISVGSADIKLLSNLAGGTGESNLVEELVGPTFEHIAATWSADYLLKIFNNSSSAVSLFSTADYLTVNDPEDLRSIIYVEIFDWSDADNDGLATPTEIGATYGKKTIVKWKTEGFSLPNLNSGTVAGFVLRFSATNISGTKQGAQAVFDFGFDAVGLN